MSNIHEHERNSSEQWNEDYSSTMSRQMMPELSIASGSSEHTVSSEPSRPSDNSSSTSRYMIRKKLKKILKKIRKKLIHLNRFLIQTQPS